ncbi:hypothetical protein JZ751_029966, partial [Albula glossodonta]
MTERSCSESRYSQLSALLTGTVESECSSPLESHRLEQTTAGSSFLLDSLGGESGHMVDDGRSFCPLLSTKEKKGVFTFQSGGSWAPNPRAGNILSLQMRHQQESVREEESKRGGQIRRNREE